MRISKIQLLPILLIFLVACAPTVTALPISPSAPLTEISAPPTDSIVAAIVDSPRLTQFYFVDENNGWGFTETQVLRTNDGGVTWYDVSPQVDASFGYLSYLLPDALTAWFIVPSNDYTTGTIYQTYNGGMTWNSIAVPFAAASFQLVDAANGFAFASLGAGAGSEAVALFKTADAGHTWTQVFTNQPQTDGYNNSLPLGGQKSGFTFLDELRGWVGGSIPLDGYIYLYQTIDGGVTWSEVNLALPGGYESAQTGNIGPQFFSATEGVLAVNLNLPVDPGTSMIVYRTSDGGVTWTAGQVIARGRPSDFRAFSEGVAWGGGPFQVTHDAGQSWSAIQPDVDFSASLVSLQFVTGQIGFVLADPSGSDQTLYKTTDSGLTWIQIAP